MAQLPVSPDASVPNPADTAPDFGSLQQAMDATTPDQLSMPPGYEPPTPPAPAEAKKPAKTETPKVEDAKTTKPWDKKAEDATPEAEEAAPEVEEAPTEDAPADLQPKAKTRWGELRKIEDSHKKMLPEYEKLKAEVETLRKAEPKIPEEFQREYDELRQFRAAHDVENTPEYLKSVVQPMEEIMQQIEEVAAYAKVDFDKLCEATDIKNRLERNRAIRQVLSTSEEEISETDIQDVVNNANNLHPIYAKAEQLRSEATDIRNSLTGKEKALTEVQQRQTQEAFQKAAEEMQTILSNSLKSTGLFENPEVTKALGDAKQASVLDDPQMAAYQVHAGAILPAMIDQWNKDRLELKEARRVLAARSKSTTTLNGGAPPAKTQEVSYDGALDELGAIIQGATGQRW